MAGEAARQQRFDYKANSNLVLPSDQSLSDRRPQNESTGEVQSLASLGFVSGEMGDKAIRSKPPIPKKHQNKKIVGHREESIRGLSIAEVDISADLNYRPTKPETKIVYETLLNQIQTLIGDQPRDVLCGAADEVLVVIRNQNSVESARRDETEELIGKLDDGVFAKISDLCRRLTDYGSDNRRKDDIDIGNDVDGVNVNFDSGEESDTFAGEVNEDADDDIDGTEANDAVLLQVLDADPVTSTTVVKDTLGRDRVVKNQLHPRDIDAHWLQRELSKAYKDPLVAQAKSRDTLKKLKEAPDDRSAERELIQLLNDDTSGKTFDLIKILRGNRQMVVHCIELASAQNAVERNKIRDKMLADPGLSRVLRSLEGENVDPRGDSMLATRQKSLRKPDEPMDHDGNEGQINLSTCKRLNLEDMAFNQGSHLMVNKECHLPDGSEKIRRYEKGYVEVQVPAPVKPPLGIDERMVPISSLPRHAQAAFEGFKELNRIQSRIHRVALEEDLNLLICAPTGAGKTNVALLTMMREIGKHVNSDDTINVGDFKIIYIAPMRSLVQEMVNNFSKRLERYNLNVGELTGDHQLSREQINECQIIVCTPEKWDIITRKGNDRTYTQIVKLVIIDEIHLLHDERGPVLEALVARMLRSKEATKDNIRLIGLSATLPNWKDVASFLHCEKRGIFFFDNSYRPVPLKQQFIGISEKKAIKRFQLMNSILYEKVMERAGKYQVLIFVHSRKDTAKTARSILEQATEKNFLGRFLKGDSSSTKILEEQSQVAVNLELKYLLPFGFAIHHAGMCREDRIMVETLFAERHIQVLVSTATLAWGVNLPAHTVIIKGTQVYNPEKSRWTELSHLDVMQMLGRAGRPQYDKEGEGILITQKSELQYYLSLMNQQLPIESQMIAKLPDLLNAECVLGNVQSVKDAMNWLENTYLYIRMLDNPCLYGVPDEFQKNDPLLERHRTNLIYTAATILDDRNLIKLDRRSGEIQATELGRIAAYFYCAHESIKTYNKMLRPTLSEIELFSMFSKSHEFRNIVIREEEKFELKELLDKVPIPIKESIEEPTAKVNVLLQAYISQLKLEGLALMADMVYVTQSAARLARAIHEIVLHRGWAQLSDIALCLCKMIDKRMWHSMSPLRQFTMLPMEAVRKLERKNFPWERLYDLKPHDIGELLVSYPKLGNKVHKCIHQLPRVDLEAQIQPITRSSLRIELRISPDFQWDSRTHGKSESFWIKVEDVDSEMILHHEFFLLKEKYATEDHTVVFFVPVLDPLPPHYFIKIVSDRWIGSENILTLPFKRLILPKKVSPPTQLLDVDPQPIIALKNPIYENIYKKKYGGANFNEIQTHAFDKLYQSDSSVVLCAAAGSGKTTCAELAILRNISLHQETSKCVYMTAKMEQAKLIYTQWKSIFNQSDTDDPLSLKQRVSLLTGNFQKDVDLLDRSNIVITDSEKWDILSRRWKQKKPLNVHSRITAIQLFIVDDLHLLGTERGSKLEVTCSRMRYIHSQSAKTNPISALRIIALASPVSNAENIGLWLHSNKGVTYNFHPSIRPLRLELYIQGFNHTHYATRLISMSRPVYQTIVTRSPTKPVLVFVATRRQARAIALDLLKFAISDSEKTKFLRCDEQRLEPYCKAITDTNLAQSLLFGVAYLHEGLCQNDIDIVERLFKADKYIQIVVVTVSLCWSITMRSYLVIIMDTQDYDGKTHAYEEYEITDIIQMIGYANRPLIDHDAKCVLMCQNSSVNYYKKFLNEPLPMESRLDQDLHDHFNAEIITGTIENEQDAVDYLTWTFLYKRVLQNPHYFGLQGVSSKELSDHLSEMVEKTLKDLKTARCIHQDDARELTSLNFGHIAFYYYLNYYTIEIFSKSINNKTRIRRLLEIVAYAMEFNQLPIRQNERNVLAHLATRVVHKPQGGDFTDPHVKANLLLQAHLSRFPIADELNHDKDIVVARSIKLILACVDVVSSSGWLNSALATMELSQMITQAVWNRDSYLKQLPHFDSNTIERCKKAKVETIFDLINLDEDKRNEILDMDMTKLSEVANYCNRYPTIDVNTRILDEKNIKPNTDVIVDVTMKGDEENQLPVNARYFPQPREEGWWIVIGDTKADMLLAIKRVNQPKDVKIKLRFTAPPDPGKYTYIMYFVCDSYLGCDEESKLEFTVQGE